MQRGDPTPAEGAVGTHYDAAARLEYFARRFGPNHLPALAQAYPVPPRTQAGTSLSPYFLSAQSCETDFSYACASIRLPLPLALPLTLTLPLPLPLPLPLTRYTALLTDGLVPLQLAGAPAHPNPNPNPDPNPNPNPNPDPNTNPHPNPNPNPNP